MNSISLNPVIGDSMLLMFNKMDIVTNVKYPDMIQCNMLMDLLTLRRMNLR